MVPGIGHVTAVRCFTVTQILQIVAMNRHAMMTRTFFLGVMKWHVMVTRTFYSRGFEVACDGKAHHIITDGSS